MDTPIAGVHPVFVTAPNRQNLWMVTTFAERNALTTAHGAAVGDFCLVDAVNISVAAVVTGASSTWRPVAGYPTNGMWGLGGKNYADTASRTVFVLGGVTYSAPLEAAPSSVTITPSSNSNWPTTPSVVQSTSTGFALSGSSSSVTPNATAWTRGTYTIVY